MKGVAVQHSCIARIIFTSSPREAACLYYFRSLCCGIRLQHQLFIKLQLPFMVFLWVLNELRDSEQEYTDRWETVTRPIS